MKIQCKRFDHSMETLRHTLEEEKRKLQIEWEVRPLMHSVLFGPFVLNLTRG